MEKQEDITEERLKDLYYKQNMTDCMIADRYGVTVNQVRYRRRKWGISLNNQEYKEFRLKNSAIFERLNEDSKQRLWQPENLDGIAKVLTHYAFRNGPVEDMHAAGKLEEEDMKTLNKYMVNRLAGILSAMQEGQWLQLELLYQSYRYFGGDWDDAEPDTEDLELLWKHFLDKL